MRLNASPSGSSPMPRIASDSIPFRSTAPGHPSSSSKTRDRRSRPQASAARQCSSSSITCSRGPASRPIIPASSRSSLQRRPRRPRSSTWLSVRRPSTAAVGSRAPGRVRRKPGASLDLRSGRLSGRCRRRVRSGRNDGHLPRSSRRDMRRQRAGAASGRRGGRSPRPRRRIVGEDGRARDGRGRARDRARRRRPTFEVTRFMSPSTATATACSPSSRPPGRRTSAPSTASTRWRPCVTARALVPRRRCVRRCRARCAERPSAVRRYRARRLVHRRPTQWLFAPYDCCALIYREPELRPSGAHADGRVPRAAAGRRRVEPLRLRGQPDSPRPRLAVLVLARGARHGRLHRGGRADTRRRALRSRGDHEPRLRRAPPRAGSLGRRLPEDRLDPEQYYDWSERLRQANFALSRRRRTATRRSRGSRSSTHARRRTTSRRSSTRSREVGSRREGRAYREDFRLMQAVVSARFARS